MEWKKDADGEEFVEDENGNKNYLDFYGSKEATERALTSLQGRNNRFCINCSYCSDCYGCSGRSGKSTVININALPEIPIIPDIHKALYEAVKEPGAFDMSEWHTCETTHSRAGWIVHLAGEAGKKLEEKTSTPFAAQQIYKASGYNISPVRFYETDEVAMADIKKLAGVGD